MYLLPIITLLLFLIQQTQQWQFAFDFTPAQSSLEIQATAFSYDNLYLITKGINNIISVFALSDYTLIHELQLAETVTKMLSHGSQYTLLIATQSGFIYRYNIESNKITSRVRHQNSTEYIKDMQWLNPQKSQFMAISSSKNMNNTIYIYDANIESINHTLIFTDLPSSFAVMPDYQSFLIGFDQVEITITNGTNYTYNILRYNSSTYQQISGYQANNPNNDHLILAPVSNDSTIFYVSYNNSNAIQLFDVQVQVSNLTHIVDNMVVRHMVAIVDDQLNVVSGESQVFVFRRSVGEVEDVLQHGSRIQVVAVSPNKRYIGVGMNMTGVRLWYQGEQIQVNQSTFVIATGLVTAAVLSTTVATVIFTSASQSTQNIVLGLQPSAPPAANT